MISVAASSPKVQHHSPAFIALPEKLFALRHRFPSVLECVLLECVRCRQWSSVEVRRGAPPEVETGEAEAAELSVVPPLSTSVADARCKELVKQEEEDERGGWHSARLREQLANNTKKAAVDAADDDDDDGPINLAPEQKFLRRLLQDRTGSRHALGNSAAEEERLSFFIPNPATYRCAWSHCQTLDVLLDLRRSWLGEMYRSVEAAKPNNKNNNNNMPNLDATSPLTMRMLSSELWRRREDVNELLARELEMRCSSRRKPGNNSISNGVELNASGKLAGEHTNNKNGTSDDLPTFDRCTQTKWVELTAQALVQDEDAVLSAYCWVVCDACGKLRRVAQPFPGGAPFVCALSASVGSCSVAEVAGLVRTTADNTATSLERAALLSPHLPFPLRKKYEDMRVGHSDMVASPPLVEEALLQRVRAAVAQRAEEVFGHVGVGERSRHATRRSDGENGCIDASVLPLLKALAASIKKRSMGSLGKELALSPAEIRRKREEVVRRAHLSDATPPPSVAEPTKKVATTSKRGREPTEAFGGGPNALRPRRAHAHEEVQDKHTTNSTSVTECADPPKKAAAPPTPPPASPGNAPRCGRKQKTLQPPSPTTTSANTTAASLTTSKPLPVAVGEKSKSKKKAAKDSVVVDDDDDTIHWVQCDECRKWRIIPEPLSSELTFWTCSMRVDGRTRCSDMDDEVRMKQEEAAKRKRAR